MRKTFSIMLMVLLLIVLFAGCKSSQMFNNENKMELFLEGVWKESDDSNSWMLIRSGKICFLSESEFNSIDKAVKKDDNAFSTYLEFLENQKWEKIIHNVSNNRFYYKNGSEYEIQKDNTIKTSKKKKTNSKCTYVKISESAEECNEIIKQYKEHIKKALENKSKVPLISLCHTYEEYLDILRSSCTVPINVKQTSTLENGDSWVLVEIGSQSELFIGYHQDTHKIYKIWSSPKNVYSYGVAASKLKAIMNILLFTRDLPGGYTEAESFVADTDERLTNQSSNTKTYERKIKKNGFSYNLQTIESKLATVITLYFEVEENYKVLPAGYQKKVEQVVSKDEEIGNSAVTNNDSNTEKQNESETTVSTKSAIADPCANGHLWKEATCTTPKICQICKKTEGSPLSHNMHYTKCTRCDYSDFSNYTINSNTFCLDSWYHLNDGSGSHYLNNGEATIRINSKGVCNLTFDKYHYTFTLVQSTCYTDELHFDCYMDGKRLDNVEITYYYSQNRCDVFIHGGTLGFSQVALNFDM